MQQLDRAFVAALGRTVGGAASVSILFSGGLDSGLVAGGLRSLLPVELVTLANLGDRDRIQATRAAHALGLPLVIAEYTERDLRRALEDLAVRSRELKEPGRSVQVALSLALRASSNERVVAGQGADELFGGYAHFRGLVGEALEARRRRDWDRLRLQDWPLSKAIAEDLGKDLRSPYLDEEFASLVLAERLDPVDPDGLTKPQLRAWARYRGIPDVVVDQPKTALQYGSGVARCVRRLTRPLGRGAPPPKR